MNIFDLVLPWFLVVVLLCACATSYILGFRHASHKIARAFGAESFLLGHDMIKIRFNRPNGYAVYDLHDRDFMKNAGLVGDQAKRQAEIDRNKVTTA